MVADSHSYSNLATMTVVLDKGMGASVIMQDMFFICYLLKVRLNRMLFNYGWYVAGPLKFVRSFR